MFMFWRKIFFTVIFFTFFSLGVHPSLAHKYEETIERNFDFKSGGKLVLSNTNGKITIRSWDEERVQIKAELRIRAPDGEEAKEIAQKAIEIDYVPEEIRITTKGQGNKSFRNFLLGRKRGVSVNYTLSVPRRVNLDIRSVNGGMGIADIEGRIEARTTNGGIGISSVSGSVNAHTTNGGIKVELNEVSPNESMSFTTTNGGIKVCLPQTIKADISARTTNGGIHTDLPLEVKGSFNSRNIRGKINGGGASIELHTTNGGISILSVSEKGDKP